MKSGVVWIAAGLLALLVAGCGDDGGSEDNNALITGEEYLTFEADGTVVTYGPEDFDTRYFVDKDLTVLVGPEGGNAFALQFSGSSTGDFTTEDLFVTYETDPSLGFPWGHVASPAYEGSSFSLKVTAYGEPGGWITGTFSGTLVEQHDTDPTGNTLAITNGSFALLRGDDK